MIGANLSDLKNYPNEIKKDKDQRTLPSFVSDFYIRRLLGKIKELETIKEDTLSDIKMKEKVFEEFKSLPQYLKAKAIANVHTAVYFGNQVEATKNKSADRIYHDLFWAVDGEEKEWQDKTSKPWNKLWFEPAQKIAEQKSFFHWELEFLEIFFEGGAPKENPGWDAVVGNPPYIQLSMDDTIRNSMQNYLLTRFTFSMGRLNTFGFFSMLGIELSNYCGLISMIVPNTLLTMSYYKDFREYILINTKIRSLLIFDSLPFQDAVVENTVFVLEKNSDTAELATHKIEIHEISDILNGNTEKNRLIPQNQYHRLFEKTFNPYLTEQKVQLFENMNASVILLNELVEINQPIALKHDRAKYLAAKSEGPNYKKVLDGRNINRYLLDFPEIYLKYEKEAIHSCKREDIFLTPEKIFFRRVGNGIIATLDEKQHYALNTLIVINSKNELFNLRYILSLINSTLLDWYYGTFLKSTKDVFSEIQARQIEQLPIHRISFTTTADRRTALLDEAMVLYSRYLSSPDSMNTLLDFVALRLAAEPEESDVVHDLLAYLAEQMIEMNTEKNEEIKSFLEWFEREIGVEIDSLTNKTKLKQYHELDDFDELIGIIKKNKNKIPVNLSNRDFQNNLKIEFDKSLSKLEPLKNKINNTDCLIDQIVYKLYGLTDEEIKIVEESVSDK